MNLSLIRDFKNGIAVIGRLAVDGQPECFTLENALVQIPAGTYKVELTFSPHFHCLMPLIDVPGREGIRIHIANNPDQLEGCIAVGQSHNLDSLNYSQRAFDTFIS